MNKTLMRVISATSAAILCVGALAGCKNTQSEYSEAYNAYDRTGERYDYDLSEYVELSQYKGITIPKIQFTVTDEKLEAEVLRKLAYYVPWEDGNDNVARKGDIVAMTTECRVNDMILSDLTKTKSYSMVVGGGIHDIPELDEALVGVKKGDKKTIEFDFPDPYMQNVYLSGEHAILDITVLDVDALQYPEDYTELLTKYYACSTLDELKDDTRTSLVTQYATYLTDYEITLAWKYVSENSKILKYPQTETDEMYNSYLASYEDYAKAESQSLEEYVLAAGDTVEAFENHLQEMAENDVKEEMLLYYIARCENITVSDEEYHDAMMEMAAGYEISDEDTAKEIVASQYGEDRFREMVRFNKVYAFLGESANVDETKTTVK